MTPSCGGGFRRIHTALSFVKDPPGGKRAYEDGALFSGGVTCATIEFGSYRHYDYDHITNIIRRVGPFEFVTEISKSPGID